jgi:hypothetical protein
MGVLTDIVVARADQADEVLAADVPSQQFPGFDAKGLDVIMLGTLSSLVGGTARPAEVVADLRLIGGDPEEGPWLFQIPDDLVVRLSKIAEREVGRIAEGWSRTEELAGTPPGDLEPMISELSRYAKLAREQSCDLLMWVCL